MSAAREASGPTRHQVLRAVAQTFPREDPGTVLGILDRYGTEQHERERERVQLAILALSHGSLAELRQLVDHAKRDYRDVLYWTELAKGYRDPFADRFLEGLLTPASTPNRLTLLTEAVPTVSWVAVLGNPAYESHQDQLKGLGVTARNLGVQLEVVPIHRGEELGGAFARIRPGPTGALLVLSSMLHRLNLEQIAERALACRVPAMCEFPEFTGAGGLLSYGPSATEMRRGAVASMRKLTDTLKGEKSASRPPERPTHLQLMINLKTAKALGLTIPQSVLIRADQVIE